MDAFSSIHIQYIYKPVILMLRKMKSQHLDFIYEHIYIYIYMYIKRGFKLYLCKKQFKKLAYITNHITVIWVCSIKDFSFFFLFLFNF